MRRWVLWICDILIRSRGSDVLNVRHTWTYYPTRNCFFQTQGIQRGTVPTSPLYSKTSRCAWKLKPHWKRLKYGRDAISTRVLTASITGAKIFVWILVKQQVESYASHCITTCRSKRLKSLFVSLSELWIMDNSDVKRVAIMQSYFLLTHEEINFLIKMNMDNIWSRILCAAFPSQLNES